jgi:hypothetical protein
MMKRTALATKSTSAMIVQVRDLARWSGMRFVARRVRQILDGYWSAFF